MRNMAGRSVFGIDVREEATHVTAAGKTLLVCHGDVLDKAIRHGNNLERFAARAYAWLIEVDVLHNQLRQRFGGDFFPLSTHIKMRLRRAHEYIHLFEKTAARYAAKRGFDGVVCGHIHRPCVREIEHITYANDGDWVEHRTAIGEDVAGNLLLLNYRPDNISVSASLHPKLMAA